MGVIDFFTAPRGHASGLAAKAVGDPSGWNDEMICTAVLC